MTTRRFQIHSYNKLKDSMSYDVRQNSYMNIKKLININDLNNVNQNVKDISSNIIETNIRFIMFSNVCNNMYNHNNSISNYVKSSVLNSLSSK